MRSQRVENDRATELQQLSEGEDNSIHGEDVLQEGSLGHIFHGIYVDEKDPDKEQQSFVKTEIKLLKFR